MNWRCVFGATALLAATTAAQAAPQDYCRAYAIDFADTAKRGSAWWQQRYDDAEKACLLQFTFDEPEPEVAAAPKKVAKAKPKPQAIPVATEPAADDVAAAVVEPAAAAPRRKPNLKEGSEAWLDYCTRKYTSFNKKTGTYTSRTGVERKCLVTADFQ
jgi:hypothetical protein